MKPQFWQSLGYTYTILYVSVASLRFGGEEKTYSDHVLVVGDAAGKNIHSLYLALLCFCTRM